jgi:hypothetical protein
VVSVFDLISRDVIDVFGILLFTVLNGRFERTRSLVNRYQTSLNPQSSFRTLYIETNFFVDVL